MDNDKLLDQLYKFVGEALNFHPTVEIVSGLRGGLFDQRADGAAAYSAKGAPVVALDGDYQRWDPEHLKYVFLHETAHHRLNHVHAAARATAAPGAVYARNAASEGYTKRIEQQADQLTATYTKRFAKWREDVLLKQIMNDLEFIKWALRQGALTK